MREGFLYLIEVNPNIDQLKKCTLIYSIYGKSNQRESKV